jgi:chromosome segregation ATPase
MALPTHQGEDYNLLKVRLETDIQNLEQHLETMRATYQLNTEKLEYNYRVLVERDHENQSTIQQQKRKIARLRDLLSNLKAKHSEMEKHSQDENVKLTEEYKRVTELFKDLQSKFKHFEQVRTERMKEGKTPRRQRRRLESPGRDAPLSSPRGPSPLLLPLPPTSYRFSHPFFFCISFFSFHRLTPASTRRCGR